VDIKFVGPATVINFDAYVPAYYLLTGGDSSARVRVYVTDSDGNAVADGTEVSFSVGSGSVLSPAKTVNGYATTVLTSGSTAGETSLTATTGETSNEVRIYYCENPFEGVHIAPLIGTIAADAGGISPIMGVALDPYGMPAPDGVSVGFSTDTGTVNTPGLMCAGSALTILNIPAQVTPGIAAVTASYNGVSRSSEVVLAGSADQINIELSAPSIPAGTTNGVVVSAQVLDANGNSLPDGTIIDFSATQGTIDPKGIVIDGYARVNLFATSDPNTAEITASYGGLSNTCNVYFSGPAATIEVYPELYSIPADGSSVCRFNVCPKDQDGRPVARGTQVNLSTSLGTVDMATVIRYKNARAVLLAGTATGTATIQATCGSASGSATVILAGSPSSISGVAYPSQLPADGRARCFIEVIIKDQGQNIVADGTVVNFSTSVGTFAPSGTATASAITVNGKAVVCLIAPSSPSTATVSVTCGSASAPVYVQCQ
jgi:hypothetical protein